LCQEESRALECYKKIGAWEKVFAMAFALKYDKEALLRLGTEIAGCFAFACLLACFPFY